MSQQIMLDIVREGLMTVMITSAPVLIIALLAGLTMSIFQTVTSIQEPTLAFIPKIVAVLFALVAFGPFMLNMLVQFFDGLLVNFNNFVR